MNGLVCKGTHYTNESRVLRKIYENKHLQLNSTTQTEQKTEKKTVDKKTEQKQTRDRRHDQDSTYED